MSPQSTPRLGRVIALDGCSSSGKSSIAKALQAMLPEAHLHVQLDAFRAMEPPGYWDDLDNETARLRVESLCRAMHATVVAHARHGQHVIFDTVLDRASAARYFDEDLAPLGVVVVAVRCSLAELERREALRADRPVGLARRQIETIHTHRRADFTVDTTATSPEQCATAIKQWLHQLATIKP